MEKDDKGSERRRKTLRGLLDTSSFRGELGSFPAGKLTPDDEGALQMAVGVEKGNVLIDFGKSVHWIALPPQLAADLASSIFKRARQAAGESGVSITFDLG